MADRVYPSAKPAAVNGSGGSNTGFPPNKAQLFNNNNTRPVYRPQGRPSSKRRRSCCCVCFMWTTILIILILGIAFLAGAVIWVIYRPERPNFSVSSLQVTEFNLTSSSQLKSKFNFTLIARNPNRKVTFQYDPVSISIFANGVDVGDGSFPGFVHGTKNTTTMRTVISSSPSHSLDTTDVSVLKKNRNNLPLRIQLETKVKVKIGSLKMKKFGIRVTCKGIKLHLPSSGAKTRPTIDSSSDIKCKFDLRIKIWKWTF